MKIREVEKILKGLIYQKIENYDSKLVKITEKPIVKQYNNQSNDLNTHF